MLVSLFLISSISHPSHLYLSFTSIYPLSSLPLSCPNHALSAILPPPPSPHLGFSPEIQVVLIMEVSDLVTHTESIFYQDACLELPLNQVDLKPPKYLLLGKLVTSKPISFFVINDVIQRAWRPTFLLKVKRIDKNIFMSSFQN